MPERCFYCLDDKISISVCVECRTRLEAAKEDAKRARREAAGWRRNYHRILNERRSRTAK